MHIDKHRHRRRVFPWRTILIFFGICFLIYYFFFAKAEKKEIVLEPALVEVDSEELLGAEAVMLEPVPQDNQKVKEYTVAEGDVPAEVFQEQGGLDYDSIQALINDAAGVYDLTNIKIGKTFKFYFDENDVLEKVEYIRDTESVVIAEVIEDGFDVWQEDIAYDVEVVTARGVIENSLYGDAVASGIQERTVAQMSQILAFDVNFFTDIQPGNEFVVHYEKRLLGEEEGPDGNIIAARFVSDKGVSDAYYYESEDGEISGYYDADGHELKKQFLQAPLSYSRISSGYTGARLHPITGTVMAHYQIDYAAPTGTPVLSTANGVVTSADWENGWGYIVRIKHENGYTTHYAHLSSFATGMRAGVGVSQEQVIGYVGSTGWSTGPHLDYGMRLNGAPVNPLTLKQPKGVPLDIENLARFREQTAGYAELLDS